MYSQVSKSNVDFRSSSAGESKYVINTWEFDWVSENYFLHGLVSMAYIFIKCVSFSLLRFQNAQSTMSAPWASISVMDAVMKSLMGAVICKISSNAVSNFG